MKFLISVLFFSAISFTALAGPKFMVASYNVENLFDTQDDPNKDDSEYLPGGKADWNDEKLNLKLNQIAAEIRAMNGGRGPDVIAMPEVENIRVLQMLAAKMPDLKYTAVLVEGGDARGIDVGLLTRIPMARAPVAVPVEDMTNPMWTKPTRPIVDVVLQLTPTVKLGVLLNHWPARMAPPPFRCRAGQVLRSVFLSHITKDPSVDYIALGDFNDDPEDASFRQCLGIAPAAQVSNSTIEQPLFYDAYFDRNLSPNLRGTYWFGKESRWNALDHVVMSKGLLDKTNVRYIMGSFTNVRNQVNVLPKTFTLPNGFTVPAGAPVPFTTFSNKGDGLQAVGVSDHLPVTAVFEIMN